MYNNQVSELLMGMLVASKQKHNTLGSTIKHSYNSMIHQKMQKSPPTRFPKAIYTGKCVWFVNLCEENAEVARAGVHPRLSLVPLHCGGECRENGGGEGVRGGGRSLQSLEVRGELVQVVHPVTSGVEGISNPSEKEANQESYIFSTLPLFLPPSLSPSLMILTVGQCSSIF